MNTNELNSNIETLLKTVLYIEAEGKNVEHATKSVLKQLNMSNDEIVVKVLSEGSPGLFGLVGSKLAKILVLPKSDRIDCIIKFFIAKIFMYLQIKNFIIDTKLQQNILSVNILIKDTTFTKMQKKNVLEFYNALFIILELFVQKIHTIFSLSLDINNIKRFLVNKAKKLISLTMIKKYIKLKSCSEVLLNVIKDVLKSYPTIELTSIENGKQNYVVLRKLT